MGFSERNRFLSDRWKELPEEERREYNKRALSEEVIANKELIKRAIKNIKREVKYSPLFIVQVTTCLVLGKVGKKIVRTRCRKGTNPHPCPYPQLTPGRRLEIPIKNAFVCPFFLV